MYNRIVRLEKALRETETMRTKDGAKVKFAGNKKTHTRTQREFEKKSQKEIRETRKTLDWAISQLRNNNCLDSEERFGLQSIVKYWVQTGNLIVVKK